MAHRAERRATSRMKVLVVEDFQLLRDSLVQGLREANYAVDSAGDGTQGLWLASSGQYDVIVLDLMLPGVDGLSILRQLRQKQSTAAVLILTARNAVDDRVKGLDAGADDYLAKPFEFAELLAKVCRAVHFAHQRVYVTVNQFAARSFGVKGAILALVRAERHVDVETGHRRSHERRVPPKRLRTNPNIKGY